MIKRFQPIKWREIRPKWNEIEREGVLIADSEWLMADGPRAGARSMADGR
jgi:hypothetical protein